LLTEASAIETSNLTNLFSVLTENEKANYITKQVALIHTSNSFLYNFPNARPSFYKSSYDLQLLLKGLSFADTKNALEAVRNSSDTSVQKLFSNWKENKVTLAKQYTLPLKDRRSDLAIIEEETEGQEKNLDISSADFRKQHATAAIKWKDVQNSLREDEAAIEFVSFDLFHNGWTDTVIYAAYVIRKNEPTPRFVILTSENKLQHLIDGAGNNQAAVINSFYRGLEGRNSGSHFLGLSLYKMIWEPLELT
jgi:hypothetical protein